MEPDPQFADPQPDTDAAPSPAAPAASATSPLHRLRAQARELVAQADELHVRIPRYDNPQVWAVYSAIDPDSAADAVERRRKSRDRDIKRSHRLWANVDVLARHCSGLYLLDGGREVGLAESEPSALDVTYADERAATFARDVLGAELRDGALTADVVRAFFVTDADLMAHAADLSRLSGLTDDDLVERARAE